MASCKRVCTPRGKPLPPESDQKCPSGPVAVEKFDHLCPNGRMAVAPTYSGAAHTPRRSCAAPGCGGRTTNRPDVGVDPPGATARARGGTRCHPRDRASSGALHRRAPRGPARRRERPLPVVLQRGAPRPGPDNAARLRRMDRQPPGEYRSGTECLVRRPLRRALPATSPASGEDRSGGGGCPL
jgi:hypothetical protein